MKTLFVTIALALALAGSAKADDYNDNIRLQGQIAQQQLQEQMNSLAVQGQLQQQRIYEQSLQMRAGGCWYNRSQPYC